MEQTTTEKLKYKKVTSYEQDSRRDWKTAVKFENFKFSKDDNNRNNSITDRTYSFYPTRSSKEKEPKRKSEDLSLSLSVNKLSSSESYLSKSLVDLSVNDKEKFLVPNSLFSQGLVKFRKKVVKRTASPTKSSRSKKASSTFYTESKQTTSKLLRPHSSPFPAMRTSNSDSSSYSSLLEALESKRMRTAFLDFLESEYSAENLCFWLSCEKFRKLKTEEQRFKEGQSIYSRFISPNSPLQINIDHVTRRQITIAMTCGDDDVAANVFDRAQSKVFSIMENDSYPRFINSDFYKDALPSKKNAFESVFSNILPNSLSPTKPSNKLFKNSNNNNNLKGASAHSEGSEKLRFIFGFKKGNV